MNKNFETMVVKRIEKEVDRTLLYKSETPIPREIHIIANLTDNIKIGDTIEYDNCGVNFGFFERVMK